MKVIELENVKKSFGAFSLDIASLGVEEGFITGFIGPNGAGKTTTIKLIMGMYRPDAGAVRVFGRDPRAEADQVKEMIGYVGEVTGYFAEAKLNTIKQAVAPFYTGWEEARYRALADRFALDGKKTYASLSKGQQKQFALALALSHRPRLLVLDEATANLDPLVRSDILDLLLEELQRGDVSVFYSTHITSDLDRAADYIVMLSHGRVVLARDKNELSETYCLVKGGPELLTAQREQALIGFERGNTGFCGLSGDERAARRVFGADVVYERASLEDIFLYTVKGETQK